MNAINFDDWVKPAKRSQFKLPDDCVGIEVYTDLGRGKIVAQFKDSTICVALEHGGGHVFMREQVVPCHARIDIKPLLPSYTFVGTMSACA